MQAKVAKVVGCDIIKYYNIVNVTVATGYKSQKQLNKQRLRKLKATI